MADLATVGFVADTSGLMKAEKGLDNLSKQGAKTDKAMSGAGASIGKSFAGIAAAVGGLVSATSAMQKLIATSREFDVLNAGLITATGSAENASAAFKAIEDFATTTPYSLGQATKAFTQLVNLGLTPSEKALTSYGNTAAAMGKDLSQMVEAVADATVGEFERLKEFGIKARSEGDNVSFTFRGMTTTVKKSAEEIEGYLIGLGQNEFASAMANRMNTLDGAISNLSDSWDGLFRTISSQGAGDLITSGVRTANDAISELTAAISSGQLGAYLDAIAGKFKAWGSDIAVILDAIGQLFAQAGEYWYLDMSESSRLMTDAFKNMPENIRALIQIATIEIASFVDKVTVYANAIAASLTFTEQVRSVEESIASINSVRESSIASIMNERDAALKSFESQITLADGLRLKYDQLSASTGTAADRLAQYKVQAVQSASATSGLTKELTNLDDAMGDHFDALEELDEIEKDRIARKEEEIDAMLEPFEEGTKAVKEYATISEKAAERVESAFADAWLNAFDGFESVVDGMKNAFKRMLAEMAHEAFTKQIMVNMGFGGSGGAAGGGAGGAMGGLGSIFGGSGGAGGLGAAFGSSALSALGPAMAMIAAGSAISKMLGGTGNLLRGGIVGDVLLGSWKNESQSLGLSLSGGDVTGTETSTDVKKKFFKNRRRSSTTAFDTSDIDDAFDAITFALSDAAKTFGITSADEVIKGFSASVNLDIKGKTKEEVAAAIQQWIGDTTGALSKAIFGDSLDGLQREGEGVIDAVSRITSNMKLMQDVSKTLGLGFDLTGKAAMIAATNIVDLAGGLEQLSVLTSQYYASFYSEAERQQNLATQLAESFGKLNVSMPATRDEFRMLVDGLDLTTEAGQEMFAALMQLVPGMSQYLSAVEAQSAAIKSQGLDLQIRLYEALGQSSEALALRRQMEIEATDESLRAMLMQIYAAEDAAAAQRELANAQNEAAASARSAAQTAFGKLQDAAQAEKDRLATELDIKLDAIEKERDMLGQQRDSLIAGYEQQGQAVQEYIGKLEGLNGVLNDFLGSTASSVGNPFNELTKIFNEVKAGLLPEQDRLSSVLSAIQGTGSSGYASEFEQRRAMAVARGQASGIQGVIGDSLSGAKSQLQWLEYQAVEADKYYTEQLTKLDFAAAEAQRLHDEQVALIDKQLSDAEKQLNALLGVDDRILSMSEASAEFYEALAEANEIQLAKQDQLIAATYSISAAIQAQTSTYWQGMQEMIKAPPSAPADIKNEGNPVTQEMADLLKEILAASKSNADHSSKSASMLQEMTVGGIDVRVEA